MASGRLSWRRLCRTWARCETLDNTALRLYVQHAARQCVLGVGLGTVGVQGDDERGVRETKQTLQVRGLVEKVTDRPIRLKEHRARAPADAAPRLLHGITAATIDCDTVKTA